MGLKVTVGFPASPARDLANREVHLSIGGAAETVELLPPDATSYAFLIERGMAFSFFLVDIDTSGNRSVASAILTDVARDSTPPPQPGTPTVIGVEELDVP